MSEMLGGHSGLFHDQESRAHRVQRWVSLSLVKRKFGFCWDQSSQKPRCFSEDSGSCSPHVSVVELQTAPVRESNSQPLDECWTRVLSNQIQFRAFKARTKCSK